MSQGFTQSEALTVLISQNFPSFLHFLKKDSDINRLIYLTNQTENED